MTTKTGRGEGQREAEVAAEAADKVANIQLKMAEGCNVPGKLATTKVTPNLINSAPRGERWAGKQVQGDGVESARQLGRCMDHF